MNSREPAPNRATFEVLNSPSWPASDDRLVDALLAFANGAEIVMLFKPGERAAPSEVWAEPRDPEEQRLRFARILQDLVAAPGRFKPAGEGKMWTQTATPEYLHGEKELLHGRPSIGGMNFVGYASNLLLLIEVKPVLVFGPHGYSIQHFRDFRGDLETLLSYVGMLLLDGTKPYGAALSKCRLASCGRFYLARGKEGGGRANRSYCSFECGETYHNSAERKREMKRPAQARPRRHK
jgi:hypothetical protein